MANTNVSSVAAMLKAKQMDLGVASVDHTKPPGDFGAFLNQLSDYQSEQMNLGRQAVRKEPLDDTKDFYAKETNQSQYKEVRITKKDSPDKTSSPDDTMRAKLASVADDVKEALKEKLGVTEEELQEVMQTLGLSFLDLLEPRNLVQLTAALTGSADQGVLLLNEDFQMLFSEIGMLAKDLLSDLGLTKEQLNEMLTQLHTDPLFGAWPNDFPEDIAKNPELLENPEMSVIQPEEAAENAGELLDADYESVMEQEAETLLKDPNLSSEMDGEGTEAAEPLLKAADSLTQNSSQDLSEDGNFRQQGETQQQLVYKTVHTVSSDGVTYAQTIQQTYVDIQDVMQQVRQFVSRIEVSQLHSTIEMQLNPENLGKLYLQVTSRDGVVTAQIAAQNEAVKDALENQLAVLKENMNQQGIKVEAVEVTVAAHEFDRNLEQNFYNRQNQQGREDSGKQARRNINLNESEDIDGALTEEESLAARMMAENGNSVDMSA